MLRTDTLTEFKNFVKLYHSIAQHVKHVWGQDQTLESQSLRRRLLDFAKIWYRVSPQSQVIYYKCSMTMNTYFISKLHIHCDILYGQISRSQGQRSRSQC